MPPIAPSKRPVQRAVTLEDENLPVSEWQAYSKMECKIAIEIGINQGIVESAILICRIYRLHACIKTQEEIIEVQPNTKSLGYRDLLAACIPPELTARLVLVVT